MKTLYVSDLDGTLLRSDETVSPYSCDVINKLVDEGMMFSYATARSLNTSKKVTKGLDAKIPLIVYNGAFVMDNQTEEILISNYFDNDVIAVLEDLFNHHVYPLVYAYIQGVEKFSYARGLCTRGMDAFLATRQGDIRTRIVDDKKDLMEGNIFYITCIDEPEKLSPLYEKYKDKYHVVYARDIYTREQWLEIMPLKASKSNAIIQLRDYLGCDRLVVFGDGSNDTDMFNIADEAYAVENAVEELKNLATEVICTNNNDGVAKWLEVNV